MISLRMVVLQVAGAITLIGCATHELVLSRTLKPVAGSNDLGLSIALFRARVDKGVLEIWSRIKRNDGDYTVTLDKEIESAAALCLALGMSDVTFENEWSSLTLDLTNEYGSQWRWHNSVGKIKVKLSRDELLELRRRSIPASEYPKYWQVVFAYKVGPPDYIPHEFRLPHIDSLPADGPDGPRPELGR